MTEIEKHYGTQPTGAGTPAGAEPDGALATAKAKLDAAASTARETIDSATDAMRSQVGSARRYVSDGYARTSDWASDRIDTASRNATYARRRSAAEFNRGRRNIERFVDDNPVMLGVAGLAAGLLVGALLPGTRRENQVFGRYADDVRDQGVRYARDLAAQGRQFVEENLQHASEAATSGRNDTRPPQR